MDCKWTADRIFCVTKGNDMEVLPRSTSNRIIARAISTVVQPVDAMDHMHSGQSCD